MKTEWMKSLGCLLMVCATAHASVTVEKNVSGIVVRNGEEAVTVSVCGPSVLHVVASPKGATGASPETPWLVKPCQASAFDFAQDDKYATLKTADVQLTVSLRDALLTFRNTNGDTLLAESPKRPRTYTPQNVNGEDVLQVTNRFFIGPSEGFYGLGQHQNGVFNYRGNVVELAQANTDVALPLLVSTNGYGLLWNTASHSWFDNRFPTEMTLTAKAADAIDYFFIYGPEMDDVVHHYREMTGHAPLFGEWAYGFVQSKDRYRSAKELLDVAAEYRDKHVPMDLIVQDWFWWKTQGDPGYVDSYLQPYPNVPEAVKKLHDEHVHSIISVWAVLDKNSETYKKMSADGLTIPGVDDYDPTNPKARDEYWKLLMKPLYDQGWDGFWLDSAEPECCGGFSDATLDTLKLSIGNGARYTNIFPLVHSSNVYEHWRATTDRRRLFILTRSAFAGQQRNSVTIWSGDVMGTWWSFRRQIPAGLNFELSGIPYWTTDIAGYGPPFPRDTRDPKYQELYTRWFEFGTFCPIMRTHGHRLNNTNEIFSYGAQVPALIAYDKWRYRMLPYTYSLAWKVTSEDYTMMRPLIMDWRTSEKVRDIGDEFMYGPALLVAPVTEEGATERNLYLPRAQGWYDFWTGERIDGDKEIAAHSPLDRIPVYVKAGSILPLGTEDVDYATEKPDAPVTLRIYRGADADFTLYEDAGDSYDYEKGAHATVKLHWDEAASTLRIAAREGAYEDMPKTRTLRLVLVGEGKGVGMQVEANADKEVQYKGVATSVALR